uniref:Leucine-rich repeat-containing protein 23 n=1 Tax=Callorhinchus milii TaxID=7868 RepID=A0A4W3GW19_CALMI
MQGLLLCYYLFNVGVDMGVSGGVNVGGRVDVYNLSCASLLQLIVTKPLTEDLVGDCISLLCKIGNGLAHAYVKLNAKERGLTDISILSTFIHLRYVDISINYLKDISPLSNLTHLLWIHGDDNLLSSAQLSDLPYLQVASFAHNRIKDTEGIGHPLLESLNLIGNEIHTISGLDGNKLNKLHTLELRGNRLERTAGLYIPSLRKLYLASNGLTNISGLERLENLQTLHLRDNLLEHLDSFTGGMKSLQYLNLRGNIIADVSEVNNLQNLPSLRALVLAENPCAEDDHYRLDTLIILRKLERLDKNEFSEEERMEADDVVRDRLEEEQEKECFSRREDIPKHFTEHTVK